MESNVLTRLKRVAARQTVTLPHYGRKSGKPYDVTIWFVVDGDKVYIGTANVNRQWVRNVQKTPQVKEVLDVLAAHCAGAGSCGYRSDARQDGSVRGNVGGIERSCVPPNSARDPGSSRLRVDDHFLSP